LTGQQALSALAAGALASPSGHPLLRLAPALMPALVLVLGPAAYCLVNLARALLIMDEPATVKPGGQFTVGVRGGCSVQPIVIRRESEVGVVWAMEARRRSFSSLSLP
jgi:hypothetical protein